MNEASRESGFGTTELLVILVIMVAVGLVGWMAYDRLINTTPTQTNTPQTTTRYSYDYSGWKTYSLKSLAVTFKYPSDWKVSPYGATCTGAVIVSVEPSSSDLASANTAMDTAMTRYQIGLYQYGVQSDKCAPDGTNRQGEWASLTSTDKLSAGVLAGKSLTFLSEDGGAGSHAYTAKPDFGVLTNGSYHNSTMLNDSGTVVAHGKTFEVTIENSALPLGSQHAEYVPFDLSIFKTTDLYKKSLAVLNSIE
jgi:hypothetical protein